MTMTRKFIRSKARKPIELMDIKRKFWTPEEIQLCKLFGGLIQWYLLSQEWEMACNKLNGNRCLK